MLNHSNNNMVKLPDIDVNFDFNANTVPAILSAGGVLILLVGYLINNSDMISGGILLAIFGALLYYATSKH